MSKEKTMQCPTCGETIATSAKACPKCGAKIKKPIYKRPWFIVIVVVFIIAIISSAGKGSSNANSSPAAGSTDTAASVAASSAPEIAYTSYEVDTLMDDLSANAMKAADTYKGQYVELTGRLSNIDSNGKYIDIMPVNDPYTFIGVQCYIKNDEQKQAVMELSKDETIIVKGKITDVGEVMGYSLDIDSISK